jgi:hypothetical protein
MSALKGATVGLVQPFSPLPTLAPAPALDAESSEWLQSLRAKVRPAKTRSHDCMRCSCAPPALKSPRRRPTLPHLCGDDLEDIGSRFTIWAYKFALLEAAVKLRRRAWQDARCRLSPKAGASFRVLASSQTPRPNRASCSKLCRTRSQGC